tara:strand:+ start:107 stop:277 length:171 start_codon:yes stop_codon:yes gene_type:complete
MGSIISMKESPMATRKKKIQRIIKEKKAKIHSYSFVDGWEEEKNNKAQTGHENKNK